MFLSETEAFVVITATYGISTAVACLYAAYEVHRIVTAKYVDRTLFYHSVMLLSTYVCSHVIFR
jgi:hypothetical protein